MEEFDLGRHEFIELCDLLKLLGWTASGGEAKTLIAAGAVTVNGMVERRKRCKLRPSQVVGFDGHQVRIVAS